MEIDHASSLKRCDKPADLVEPWSPRRLDFTATNFVVFGAQHCATCDAKMFLMALWGLWPWKLQYAFVIFGFKHLGSLSFNPMDWNCKGNFDSDCWWWWLHKGSTCDDDSQEENWSSRSSLQPGGAVRASGHQTEMWSSKIKNKCFFFFLAPGHQTEMWSCPASLTLCM